MPGLVQFGPTIPAQPTAGKMRPKRAHLAVLKQRRTEFWRATRHLAKVGESRQRLEPYRFWRFAAMEKYRFETLVTDRLFRLVLAFVTIAVEFRFTADYGKYMSSSSVGWTALICSGPHLAGIKKVDPLPRHWSSWACEVRIFPSKTATI